MPAYEDPHVRFWRFVDKSAGPDACWIWKGAFDGRGYGVFGLSRPRRVIKAHRFALLGSDPAEVCVLHRCDVTACVNPAHLFMGTRADNNLDKLAKGREARGERHGQAKLTEVQVQDIRARRAAGASCRSIAVEFQVSRSAVGLIATGKRWIGGRA